MHIVTPNSMNNDVFVAAVIERLSWRSNNSMVGHENIIEVAVSELNYSYDTHC